MIKKILVATAFTGALVAGGFTLQAQNTNQTANAEQVVQKKSSFVSKKQAEKAALKVVKGYVDDVDLERKKGKWVYEVEIKKGGFEKPISKRILVPVRMIWGMEDKFLSRKLAKETIKICPNGQLIFVDDATHWINHEKPDVVNKLILEFLT